MKSLYRAIKFYLASLVVRRTVTDKVSGRLMVCVECEFNSGGVCAPCGCVIKAKVLCEECECPKELWPK